MAVLHVELDIDSDVHPELHAMLSSIGSCVSRAERLRQLASAGLIWEHLRVPAPTGVSPSVGNGGDKFDPDRAPDVAAGQLQAPREPPAVETFRAEQVAAPELPVLHDAIEAHQIARPKRAAARHGAAAGAIQSKEIARLQPARVRTRPADDTAVSLSDAEHLSPPARQSGTRSRLRRMKEMGLFNNG